MTGKECFCQCHVNDNIKHMAACCCPHRVKSRRDCDECQRTDPPLWFRVKIKEDGIEVYDDRTLLKYPLDDPDTYWLTQSQVLEQMDKYSEESRQIEEIRTEWTSFPPTNWLALENAKERIRHIGRRS